MAKTIGIIVTLGTKWPEISYLKKEIERRPLEVSEKAVNDPEFSSPCC
jgi:hypothetical protein